MGELILFIILYIVGISYIFASEWAMFEYVVKDDGDAKKTGKEFVIAVLLIPVALIIGPYFIYKVLDGGSK